MIISILASAEIPSVIQDEAAATVLGGFGLPQARASILVAREDEDEARAIIDELIDEIAPGRCPDCGYDLTGNRSLRCPECGRAFQPDPDPWVCASCGEEIEGSFAVCWNCETERE